MLAPLFAINFSWPAILVLLAILGFLWFVVRALREFVEWFNEEILEDYRDRKRNRNSRTPAPK